MDKRLREEQDMAFLVSLEADKAKKEVREKQQVHTTTHALYKVTLPYNALAIISTNMYMYIHTYTHAYMHITYSTCSS